MKIYAIASECSTAGYYYVMQAENIDDAVNKYLNTIDEKEREKVLRYGSSDDCVVLREGIYETTIKEVNFENLDTTMISIGFYEE
jgi:hypothetical protein